jgi:hypothetical protein
MPDLMLGKQPATEDQRDLMFAKYVKPKELPTPPSQFGHETLFGAKDWGMLGNDQWGDCAWAGPAHETMLLAKEGGKPTTFSTDAVLSDYSAGTGFDPHAGPPGHNPTDQGSNVREVLKYRAKTGIVDAGGTRHKIGAYVKLDPGNVNQIEQALYLFEVVGIGIQFPGSAMDQFNNGHPWDVVAGAQIEGGHYIPLVAKRDNLGVVTWGALQEMTHAFYEKYCDEAWAYISEEDLQEGKSPEGFAIEELQADLAAL